MNTAAKRLRQESCALEPTHQLPTCADHLHCLLELSERVLDACELTPDDVGEAGPFERVAELLQVAIDERDHHTERRLRAALDFAAILRESARTADVDALEQLVDRGADCLARMTSTPLEVVRG